MEQGGWLSNLGAICLHADGPSQRPAGSCYFPWQACCLQCNRWFTSRRGTDQHPILGAEQSKSKVWTSPLITNYRLDGEGWSFPRGWVPSGPKSDQKEEPRPLPPLINLSQRRCWSQSVWVGSNSPDSHLSEEFLIQVGYLPPLPSSLTSFLYPPATAKIEPAWPSVCPLSSLNSPYNFSHFYPPRDQRQIEFVACSVFQKH